MIIGIVIVRISAGSLPSRGAEPRTGTAALL
jgi:hypothetical protein